MQFNSLFVENCLPTWAIEPKNWTGAASNGVWASLKGYNRVTVAIITGAWAGGTAAVTLQQAVDVSGTSSKSLNFSVDGYSTANAATQANLWTNTSTTGALTTAAISSNTFNLDTANKLYVFEVYARSLDLANSFDCFRVQVASPGSNADFYGALYLFGAPRFMQSATAMIDPYVN